MGPVPKGFSRSASGVIPSDRMRGRMFRHAELAPCGQRPAPCSTAIACVAPLRKNHPREAPQSPNSTDDGLNASEPRISRRFPEASLVLGASYQVTCLGQVLRRWSQKSGTDESIKNCGVCPRPAFSQR